MADEPEDPKKPKQPWWAPPPKDVIYPSGYNKAPEPPDHTRTNAAGFQFYTPPPEPKPKTEDEKLAEALASLLKPLSPTAERPPVELAQDRRAHVAQFSAEFKEWVANGLSRGEALQLVAMEIQLHWRFNKGQGG